MGQFVSCGQLARRNLVDASIPVGRSITISSLRSHAEASNSAGPSQVSSRRFAPLAGIGLASGHRCWVGMGWIHH
jgi:hypothetical protein